MFTTSWGWPTAGWVARALGADGDVAQNAVAYIQVRLFGGPAVLISMIAFGAMRGRQDMRTPVKIAIRAMIANMVMNVLFVVPLVLLQIPGAHAGLALATALASYVNAGLLYRHLRRAGVFRPEPGWLRLLLQMLFAVTVMAVVVWLGAPDSGVWATLSGAQRAMQISLWIVAGVASYLLALRLAGLRLSMLWAPAA